jgi:hypothetical protein
MNHLARNTLFAAAAMVLVASQGTAQAAQGAETTPAASNPRTIHIPVTMIDTPERSGSNGIVTLRMGNSTPIKVMVDTGSIGLRLWSAPKSIVARATTRIETPLDGASVPARLGTSRISLGPVTTTSAVPFAVINAESSYIDEWRQAGVSGILGIGIGASSGDLTNPLTSMPDSYGQQWSLHFSETGALVLGAQPPPGARMHFPLTSAGVDVNRNPLWNDKDAPGCWRFGLTIERCVPTFFDSGFTVMRIKGEEFARLPMTASNQLKPGTRVALSAGSSAFIGDTFLAGNVDSRNFARVIPKGKASINTGNSYFFRYTVTYNALTGDIYLSDPSRKGNDND